MFLWIELIILLGVILFSIILLSVILTSGILLSTIVPSVIIQSCSVEYHYYQCHSAEYHRAECYSGACCAPRSWFVMYRIIFLNVILLFDDLLSFSMIVLFYLVSLYLKTCCLFPLDLLDIGSVHFTNFMINFRSPK